MWLSEGRSLGTLESGLIMTKTYIYITIHYIVPIMLILFSGEKLLIIIGVFLLIEGIVVYIVGKREYEKRKKASEQR